MIRAIDDDPATPPAFDAGSPLPEGKAKQELVRSMFDSIAPRYDLVNRLMTFGLDSSWRRRTIALLQVSADSVVLDVGCGTGDFARELRRAGRRSLGVDLSFGMLAAARSGGAPLVQADAAALPLRSGTADGVVSGFAVRNFADLPGVLDELSRVLATRRQTGTARGRRAAVAPCAPRTSHLVHPGGTAARGALVRRRRLPVPASFGRLPAVVPRVRAPSRGRRLRATCSTISSMVASPSA